MKPLYPVIASFFGFQLLVVLGLANGAFTDEGIYVLAGRSTLHGARDMDAFARWLDGSPFLFPTLSALGHALGGLAGSRLVSVVLCCVGLWFFERFAHRCFGPAAAFWAVLLLALNGAFCSLAHLAVYDSLAFAALTFALASGLELVRSPSPKYLWRTALAAALAATSKYSMLILLVPALPVVLLGSARRRWRPALLATLLAAAVAALYMYIAHGELIPRQTWQTLTTHPELASRRRLAFALACWLVLPFCLAVVGALQLRGRRSRLAWWLLVAGLIWPALHLLTAEGVSASKHVALSGIYLYPLAGVALARLDARSRGAAVATSAAALAWGALQMFVQDHSWPDVRPVAQFLIPDLDRFDTVGTYAGWDFALYAVAEGPIVSSSFVMSEGRTRQGEDPCDNRWLIGVETPPSTPDPQTFSAGSADAFARAARRCGFEWVASFSTPTFALAPPLVAKSPTGLVLYRRRDGDGARPN